MFLHKNVRQPMYKNSKCNIGCWAKMKKLKQGPFGECLIDCQIGCHHVTEKSSYKTCMILKNPNVYLWQKCPCLQCIVKMKCSKLCNEYFNFRFGEEYFQSLHKTDIEE